VQLVETGVRCVEVTLSGWDTHAENESLVKGRCDILDPAYAALMKQLKARGLLESTVVLWAGEFGRTPTVNPVDGRDHWPHGFTVALGGGGIRGGRVIGSTAPKPKLDEKDRLQDLTDPRTVEDLHATVLKALGLDHETWVDTPIGRPMRLTMESAKSIDELLV
jgi:uncharacterized protein (DUF1501 family)